MKISRKIIIAICLVLTLGVGCSSNTEENKNNLTSDNIENQIPYIDEYSGEIDNDIITERYENIKKEELSYDEAIDLVKKVLPDDIKQVDLKVDEDINKEYIYYESSKGKFRVGLCYGYEFNDENVEVVNKNKIVGIDYSKEIK